MKKTDNYEFLLPEDNDFYDKEGQDNANWKNADRIIKAMAVQIEALQNQLDETYTYITTEDANRITTEDGCVLIAG